MAKITKQIGFRITIDEDEIAPASVNVWIYQLLNRLGYEHEITEITIDEVTIAIESKDEVKDLPIGKEKELTQESMAEVRAQKAEVELNKTKEQEK